MDTVYNHMVMFLRMCSKVTRSLRDSVLNSGWNCTDPIIRYPTHSDVVLWMKWIVWVDCWPKCIFFALVIYFFNNYILSSRCKCKWVFKCDLICQQITNFALHEGYRYWCVWDFILMQMSCLSVEDSMTSYVFCNLYIPAHVTDYTLFF